MITNFKYIGLFLAAFLFADLASAQIHRPSVAQPKKVRSNVRGPASDEAPVTTTTPATSEDTFIASNKKTYKLLNGFLIREENNKTFAKVDQDREIELPNPIFSIEFSKFPKFKTDLAQRRALATSTAEKYFREYERIYLASSGLEPQYSPFKTTLDYSLYFIQNQPAQNIDVQIFPPKGLKKILDENTISFERAGGANMAKDIILLKNKNQNLEKKVSELSAKLDVLEKMVNSKK